MRDRKVRVLIVIVVSLVLLGSAFVIWSYFSGDYRLNSDNDSGQVSNKNSEKESDVEDYERNGRLYLKRKEEGSLKINEGFILELYVDTAGSEVDGFDAKINYDPDKVEVMELKIDDSAGFETFPVKSVANGKVLISGLAPVNEPLSGDMRVAEFKVIPKVNGDLGLSFVFEVGSTIDSNVVEHGSVHDILGEVGDFDFQVE